MQGALAASAVTGGPAPAAILHGVARATSSQQQWQQDDGAAAAATGQGQGGGGAPAFTCTPDPAAEMTCSSISSVSSSSSNSSSVGSNPWQRLLDWMRRNGAVINVDVTDAGPRFGRVVTAREPVIRGDLLASIPLNLVWYPSTPPGSRGGTQVAAAHLWAAMADAHSPYRPYFDALPPARELVCPLVMLPSAYLPLLANADAERFVARYQEHIQDFWEAHGADLTAKLPSMTLDSLKYATSLLSTRAFTLQSGSAMVPLLDLANHAPNCPNIHWEQACPQDPAQQCLVWAAGAFHAQGAEVCNGYKYMLNDKAMLQYGFLQSGHIQDSLHTMDHAAFNSTNFSALFSKTKYGPEPFDGDTQELAYEVARLQSSLHNITASDAAAAAAVPASDDRDRGRLLRLLLEWRQQRKAALQKDIARLQQRLAEGGAQRLQQQQVSAQDKLLGWIEENGGQVCGVRIGSTTGTTHGSGATANQGVFATRPTRPGQLLAVVPLSLALPINTENAMVDSLMVHSEITAQLSPRAPHYATLPAPSEVFSFYNLPLQYAPVLQHPHTEAFLQRLNATLARFVRDNKEMALRGMTLAHVRHVLSLVATRLFDFREGGHIVPLLDLANHHNGCKHSVAVTPCDALPAPTGTCSSRDHSGSSPQHADGINTTEMCVVWTAGADVSTGEEVCLSRGWLLPDRAVLQYGFIPGELLPALQQQPQDQVVVPLLGLDRHDFDQSATSEQLPWSFWLDAETAPPRFQGDLAQTAAEVARLRSLLQELSAGDAAAAAVLPAADVDPQGMMLQQLRQLRELRKLAITQEVDRLSLSLPPDSSSTEGAGV